MKNKFNKSNTMVDKKLSQSALGATVPTPKNAGGKKLPSYNVGISDKVSSKQMEKIDVSLNKGGEIDIDR